MPKIKRGKTIALFSAKGGVGKTINTLNLAGIFVSLKKRVLIIDLDLVGGAIGVALATPSVKNIYHLCEDINTNRYTNFEEYITNYNEYIDFISAPKDPRQATKISHHNLQQIMDKARSKYDVVLIDTSHYLSDINLVTLDIVDSILFIVTNDPFHLKNLKSLLVIFEDLEIKKYKVILNNSVDPSKEYFSLFDIKNIINANIDYSITPRMHLKNIDKYIMNGEILTLDKKFSSVFPKDYTMYMTLAADLLTDESGDEL